MADLYLLFSQILWMKQTLGIDRERSKYMDYEHIPVGLGLSLAMNERAMHRYANMTEAEKEKTIAMSREVKSKREMDRIVHSLAQDDEK